MKNSDANNFTIVLEGGCLSETQNYSEWVISIIRNRISNLEQSIPTVVSYNALPEGIDQVEGLKKISISNRKVFSQIRKSTNREILLFGDWAGANARTKDSTQNQNYFWGGDDLMVPRIDFPLTKNWVIARNTTKNWSFQDAAKLIVDSEYWKGDLNIWGENLIKSTAEGESNKIHIKSSHLNIQSRVNIHMWRQISKLKKELE